MSPHVVSPAGYRYAERVGQQLFVAGQVPLDSDFCLVGVGDPKAQARQCLNNLGALIRQHKFELADIRRVVVYVAGEQENLHVAWEAVVEWFVGETPPATLLGVSWLGYEGQIVEIDATVVKAVETDD